MDIRPFSGYLCLYSCCKYLVSSKKVSLTKIKKEWKDYQNQRMIYYKTKSIFHMFNAIALFIIQNKGYTSSLQTLIIWSVLFSEIKLLSYNIPGICALLSFIGIISFSILFYSIEDKYNNWYEPIIFFDILILNLINFIQSLQISNYMSRDYKNNSDKKLTPWDLLFKCYKGFSIIYQSYLLLNINNYLSFLLLAFIGTTIFVDKWSESKNMIKYILNHLVIINLFKVENQFPWLPIVIYNLLWEKCTKYANHFQYVIIYSVLTLYLQKNYIM